MGRPRQQDSLMNALRTILEQMEIGDEKCYDPSNRNFISVRNTFFILTRSNKDMVDKKFEAHFTEGYDLFVIKRTA